MRPPLAGRDGLLRRVARQTTAGSRWARAGVVRKALASDNGGEALQDNPEFLEIARSVMLTRNLVGLPRKFDREFGEVKGLVFGANTDRNVRPATTATSSRRLPTPWR